METALAVKGRMIAKSVQLVLISRSMVDQEICIEFAGNKIHIDYALWICTARPIQPLGGFWTHIDHQRGVYEINFQNQFIAIIS